jgi:hypothetical protein
MDTVSEGAKVSFGAPAEPEKSEFHGESVTTFEQDTVLQAAPVD